MLKKTFFIIIFCLMLTAPFWSLSSCRITSTSSSSSSSNSTNSSDDSASSSNLASSSDDSTLSSSISSVDSSDDSVLSLLSSSSSVSITSSEAESSSSSAMGSFTLISDESDDGFTPEGDLPLEFKANISGQCSGSNNFPKLKWENPPLQTKSFVLIVDDLDGMDWVHLNLYNLSSNATEIPKLLGSNATITSFGSIGDSSPSLGQNDWSVVGWRGPCPPSGTHTYYFKLYAMNVVSLSSLNKTTRSEFESANSNSILSSVEINVNSTF